MGRGGRACIYGFTSLATYVATDQEHLLIPIAFRLIVHIR